MKNECTMSNRDQQESMQQANVVEALDTTWVKTKKWDGGSMRNNGPRGKEQSAGGRLSRRT